MEPVEVSASVHALRRSGEVEQREAIGRPRQSEAHFNYGLYDCVIVAHDDFACAPFPADSHVGIRELENTETGHVTILQSGDVQFHGTLRREVAKKESPARGCRLPATSLQRGCTLAANRLAAKVQQACSDSATGLQ